MEKYCYNLPFPEVNGKISQNTLDILMEVYAGKSSEFTLEQSYRYTYFLSLGELRSSLKQILNCKKLHLEHLAEAIIFYGGLPLFSGAKSFWSGGVVEYSVGKTAINNLIGLEQALLSKYENIIEKEENLSLKKLISRLIMDSQLHISVLKSFV